MTFPKQAAWRKQRCAARLGQQIELTLSRFGKRLQGSVVHASEDRLRIAFDRRRIASRRRRSHQPGDDPGPGEADEGRSCRFRQAGGRRRRGARECHRAAWRPRINAAWGAGTMASAITPRWRWRRSRRSRIRITSVHDSGRRALAALATDDLAAAQREVAAMREASGQVMENLDAFGREFPVTIRAERQMPADRQSSMAAA